jgi:hypothetical protein
MRLRLTLHPATYVYSVELLDRGCRRAERARYVLAVRPAEGTLLSDVVLADELHYGDMHRGADRIRGRAPVTVRPSLKVEAGSTARFYWEIYGVDADSTHAGRLLVEFEVVTVREQPVALRELGRVVEDAEHARGTLDLSYHVNVPPGHGPLSVGLAVGLPDGSRGVHVARLTVTDTVTGRSETAQRAFLVPG